MYQLVLVLYRYLNNVCCSRALMRYKFDDMYELGSLAVVNVRDLGSIKHAFKLLAFPDTRVFQCSSNSSKVKAQNVKELII